MIVRAAFLLLFVITAGVASTATSTNEEMRHVPSIVYGQILLGPAASRYETIFTITSKKGTSATLDLFTDRGEPMEASFVDSTGIVASTDSTFRFYLNANQPVRIKVQLAPDAMQDDVALKTGWANFHASEELDVWALVRILKPNGTLIDKHVLLSEKPPHS